VDDVSTVQIDDIEAAARVVREIWLNGFSARSSATVVRESKVLKGVTPGKAFRKFLEALL